MNAGESPGNEDSRRGGERIEPEPPAERLSEVVGFERRSINADQMGPDYREAGGRLREPNPPTRRTRVIDQKETRSGTDIQPR